MIQKRDDQKPDHPPFKIRALLLALDEYMQIFIIPQIPAGFKDLRASLYGAMSRAWHELFHAAGTTKRERQKHLLLLKIELSMLEIYTNEIRDICYRGKESRKLDKNTERRLEIFAAKQKEVLTIVWAWIKNENSALDASTTQATAGLTDGVLEAQKARA